MREPLPLPDEVQQLCHDLKAPARLVTHLQLVHDVACQIIAGLEDHFPTLEFVGDTVCFGAATHDLGKMLHPDELARAGTRHEEDGFRLLENHGKPPYGPRIVLSVETFPV